MDLSSAFECVNRSKLWAMLEFMGLEADLVSLNFYTGISQPLRFGEAEEGTSPFKVNRGVRQGCVLSPILLLLYINDLEMTLDVAGVDVTTHRK